MYKFSQYGLESIDKLKQFHEQFSIKPIVLATLITFLDNDEFS